MTESASVIVPDRLMAIFNDYAAAHRTFGNKVTHYIGIPLIIITTLGLLGGLPIAGGLTGSDFFRLDGGSVLLMAGFLWYLSLDWKIAIPFSMLLLGMYFLGRALPTGVAWALWVIGWVAQFVGHAVYEKKSPAFFQNLQHLLIGPLWIFARAVGYIR
jgi:uncharacterized membrane protein YGL010W